VASETLEMLKRLPEGMLEVEVNSLVHVILEDRERLTEILSRYGVKRSEEIKVKIAKGELKAHPAFKDSLSALAYRIDMEDMIRSLKKS